MFRYTTGPGVDRVLLRQFTRAATNQNTGCFHTSPQDHEAIVLGADRVLLRVVGNNVVVGGAYVYVRRGEPWIYGVCVSRAHQKRGHGRALVLELVRRLAAFNARYVYLDIDVPSRAPRFVQGGPAAAAAYLHKLQGFYRRLGFELVAPAEAARRGFVRPTMKRLL